MLSQPFPEIHVSHPNQLFINGHWVDAREGATIDVIAPNTEERIITVAQATEPDIDAAVRAARKAFDEGPWPHLSHAERVGYLRKISAILEPRLPEISRAWVDQVGALAVAASTIVDAGKFWFDYYAGLGDSYEFEHLGTPFDGQGTARVVREPVGVAAAIVPWNNPFGIMTGKIAPALLAGCTVVMKPAPETPIDAYIIAEAAEQAGLPAGVLNLVTAHREASDYLVRQPGVEKVSFTGSVAAGQRIASVCGERLARCTLELGGKSAAIVLDDYDIGTAAKTLASVITMSSGQICATLSRAVVSRERHDDLVDAIREEMASIIVGDPYDDQSMMGPLAMSRQRDRVEGYIAIGKAEGATLAFGGGRPEHLERGFYVEPTLFSDVTTGMRIANEEIFGPVLTVLSYESEEEAIRIANSTPYGLYGAVLTNDPERAYRIARQMRTGTVSHNSFRFDPSLPFGGFKNSGIGREGGESGLASFTEVKSLLLEQPQATPAATQAMAQAIS